MERIVKYVLAGLGILPFIVFLVACLIELAIAGDFTLEELLMTLGAFSLAAAWAISVCVYLIEGGSGCKDEKSGS